MTIECVDPRTDAGWTNLLSRMPSNVFQSPPWLSVLADTYDWTPRAHLMVGPDGEPTAGLPFCRIADMFGERIVTLPFSDYCDPLVASVDSWRHLTDELVTSAQATVLRCLHCDVPLTDPRFAVYKRAKWHGIDLTPSLEQLWAGLDDRSCITRSQRNGVSVRWATESSELREFFEMHLTVRKYKYGMLAQPFSFFENIWRHFIERGLGYLLLAVWDGRIVGGVILLRWQDTLYYKFNASVSAGLAHRPNDLLVWECMKHGKAIGCSQFDFGLSDWDQEGLISFKRKFGATEKTISFLRHDPDRTNGPTHDHARSLLTNMTRLFVDRLVDDSVTERAGAELYRYFV